MKGVTYLTEIDKIITTYEEDSKVKEVYSYDLVKETEE